MSVVLLLARLVLAVVFAAAAVAKLADRTAFARTLESFGAPRRTAPSGSLAIPLAGLGVATSLLPTASSRWAAFGALVLLTGFCVVIARVLARGEQVDCGCFGSARPAPVGKRTLARTGALAALALLVVVSGPGRALALPDVPAISLSLVALGTSLVAVVLSCWLSWQLFRQNGRLLARIAALEASSRRDEDEAVDDHSGLPRGADAPSFDLTDPQGRRRTLDDLLEPGLPLALVFSDPDCGACQGLAEHVERARAMHSGSLEIALITRATTDSRRDLADMETVLFERQHEVGTSYRVRTVPYATIVDPLGRITGIAATGRPAVEELLRSDLRAEAELLEAVA